MVLGGSGEGRDSVVEGSDEAQEQQTQGHQTQCHRLKVGLHTVSHVKGQHCNRDVW